MALARLLEDFDAGAAAVATPPRDPASDPLYQEGYAAGLAARQAEDARLEAELIQTIGEIAFGYAEAQAMLLASLSPLFDAISDKLVPASRDGFPAHVAAALMSAATQDLGRPLELQVHPRMVAAIAQTVARQSGLALRVLPNAALPEHAARFSGPHGETLLDIDGLCAALRESIAALTDTQTELQAYG